MNDDYTEGKAMEVDMPRDVSKDDVRKELPPIALDDLIPEEDVCGGTEKRVLFGVLRDPRESSDRRNAKPRNDKREKGE